MTSIKALAHGSQEDMSKRAHNILNVNILTLDPSVHCLGVMDSSTPECYEPKAIAALREWFAETSRRVIVCGPLIPSGEQAIVNEKRQTSNASEISDFLDAVLESHGPKSLVYVSFDDSS